MISKLIVFIISIYIDGGFAFTLAKPIYYLKAALSSLLALQDPARVKASPLSGKLPCDGNLQGHPTLICGKYLFERRFEI